MFTLAPYYKHYFIQTQTKPLFIGEINWKQEVRNRNVDSIIKVWRSLETWSFLAIASQISAKFSRPSRPDRPKHDVWRHHWRHSVASERRKLLEQEMSGSGAQALWSTLFCSKWLRCRISELCFELNAGLAVKVVSKRNFMNIICYKFFKVFKAFYYVISQIFNDSAHQVHHSFDQKPEIIFNLSILRMEFLQILSARKLK